MHAQYRVIATFPLLLYSRSAKSTKEGLAHPKPDNDRDYPPDLERHDDEHERKVDGHEEHIQQPPGDINPPPKWPRPASLPCGVQCRPNAWGKVGEGLLLVRRGRRRRLLVLLLLIVRGTSPRPTAPRLRRRPATFTTTPAVAAVLSDDSDRGVGSGQRRLLINLRAHGRRRGGHWRARRGRGCRRAPSRHGRDGGRCGCCCGSGSGGGGLGLGRREVAAGDGEGEADAAPRPCMRACAGEGVHVAVKYGEEEQADAHADGRAGAGRLP